MREYGVYRVGQGEWDETVVCKYQTSAYPDVYVAIGMLRSQPVGAKVKLPSGEKPAMKRRILSDYARRHGIRVKTYPVGDWIYAFSIEKLPTKSAKKGVTTGAKETSVSKYQSGDGAAPSRVASL